MAIYLLRCGDGHDFEVIQTFTAPLPVCPDAVLRQRRFPSRSESVAARSGPFRRRRR